MLAGNIGGIEWRVAGGGRRGGDGDGDGPGGDEMLGARWLAISLTLEGTYVREVGWSASSGMERGCGESSWRSERLVRACELGRDRHRRQHLSIGNSIAATITQ